MCRLCHGAPGIPAEVFAQGLYPAPADLLSGSIQQEWKDNQLYWIVENGLKLTGMPVLRSLTQQGNAHRSTVAFLKRLPGMTPNNTQTLMSTSEGDRAQVR